MIKISREHNSRASYRAIHYLHKLLSVDSSQSRREVEEGSYREEYVPVLDDGDGQTDHRTVEVGDTATQEE